MTTEQAVTSEAADGSLAFIAALPDDIRGIVVERALRAAMEGSEMDRDTYDPVPGLEVPALERRLEDKTTTDRTQVLVFSMQNGEPHQILRIDRRRVLQQNLPDGSPAFWAPGMPGRPPARVIGQTYCYLHPDSPDREIVDALGFAGRFCNDGDRTKRSKADFKNSVDRDEHTKRKHTAFWATWETAKVERRADEAMALQRATLEAMQEIARGNVLANQQAAAVTANKPAPARKPALVKTLDSDEIEAIRTMPTEAGNSLDDFVKAAATMGEDKDDLSL